MRHHYHLIGIGGVGMSALAKILLDKGEKVSGSDLTKTYVTASLEQAGARIDYTHSKSHVNAGQIIVYSTAIDSRNPELVQAKKIGCKMIHRVELLAMLTLEKKSLVVTGCHGKTTTTMLLSHVMSVAGYAPSYVVGGFSKSLPGNGLMDYGEWFVSEGDESDGSFLKVDAYGAIVTNVSFDHVDYWGSEASFDQAFYDFCKGVKSLEHFVWCFDDPKLSSWELSGISYGFTEGAMIRGINYQQIGPQAKFDIIDGDMVYRNILLNLVGEHNALNALGAFAMARCLGLETEAVFKAFQNFEGVARRLELKGEKAEITVYDDYAHHPEEVEKTLLALRMLSKKRRIIALFQPHRYSRLARFAKEFAEALRHADVLIVTDVYSAGEAVMDGVTAELFFQEQALQIMAHYVPRADLTEFLQEFVKQGDILITLGAGDVTKVGGELLAAL